MKKREAQFQTKFNKWLRHEWVGESTAFELKVIKKGRALPFNAVKPHQLRALKACEGKFVYKISDMDRVQKPFDCFIIKNVLAYIVIQWYSQNEKKFYIISVDNFIDEMNNSKRKSLTEYRASLIGSINYLK